jgi:hypothetical protein
MSIKKLIKSSYENLAGFNNVKGNGEQGGVGR